MRISIALMKVTKNISLIPKEIVMENPFCATKKLTNLLCQLWSKQLIKMKYLATIWHFANGFDYKQQKKRQQTAFCKNLLTLGNSKR